MAYLRYLRASDFRSTVKDGIGYPKSGNSASNVCSAGPVICHLCSQIFHDSDTICTKSDGTLFSSPTTKRMAARYTNYSTI